MLVYSGGIVHPLAPAGPFVLPDLLAREGFEVTLYAPGSGLEPRDFDLVLYLFGDETLLTRSAIFIDWMKLDRQTCTAPWTGRGTTCRR